MDIPVRIFIDRKELIGYTGMTLRRSKEELTGELTVKIFMGYQVNEPLLVEATKGREILVYIGGHLAFTGGIDRRKDTGFSKRKTRRDKSGSIERSELSLDSYEVEFKARGKTKYLIDSSHQELETLLNTTNKDAVTILTEPWKIPIEWLASVTNLPRVRLTDGGLVSDELQRLAEESSLYMTETRDGALRVTDGTQAKTGEPIVLGQNILSFSADQAEDKEKTEVTVRGNLTGPDAWGDSAIIPTTLEIGTIADAFTPFIIRHFGNADEQALQKRAQYEANRRNAMSKTVRVDVFHVQTVSGNPWDIGDLHYVEIPPANIFNMMEVTELTYFIDADKTLKTELVLTPPGQKLADKDAKREFLADVPEVSDVESYSKNRKSESGVSGSNMEWDANVYNRVEDYTEKIQETVKRVFLGDVLSEDGRPPLSLPVGYESKS